MNEFYGQQTKNKKYTFKKNIRGFNDLHLINLEQKLEFPYIKQITLIQLRHTHTHTH